MWDLLSSCNMLACFYMELWKYVLCFYNICCRISPLVSCRNELTVRVLLLSGLHCQYQWCTPKRQQKCECCYGSSCCVQVYVFLRLTTKREPDLQRAESEKSFMDPETEKRHPFPSITSQPSVYMTLVVPAYNEQNRCKHSFVHGLTRSVASNEITWWLLSAILKAQWNWNLSVYSAEDDGRDDGVFGEETSAFCSMEFVRGWAIMCVYCSLCRKSSPLSLTKWSLWTMAARTKLPRCVQYRFLLRQ